MNEPAVELFQSEDKWVVRISEAGETEDRVFQIESHAASYAAGQSIRLGIQPPAVDDSVAA
jgi:hypothetical protein